MGADPVEVSSLLHERSSGPADEIAELHGEVVVRAEPLRTRVDHEQQGEGSHDLDRHEVLLALPGRRHGPLEDPSPLRGRLGDVEVQEVINCGHGARLPHGMADPASRVTHGPERSNICTDMSIAQMLTECRAEAGLSQAELARRAGTSQATVSAYESGTKSPAVATLERLLAATGHSLELTALRRPVAADLSGPIGRRLRSRMREVRAILSAHGASQLRVFGSVARGEDTDDSDLDLLVRLGDDATLLTLASLERELSELLDVDVDVVTDGALSSSDEAFVNAVLGEAVPL